MKKTYALDELDCANCGLKMEEAVRKIEGVKSVNICFHDPEDHAGSGRRGFRPGFEGSGQGLQKGGA